MQSIRLVQPVGPLNATIAIIGEAPGKDEDEQGKPFVGASGKLLDSILAGAGLQRRLIYITNVVKERPPNNNIRTFIDLRKGVTMTEKYKAYESVLAKELTVVNPNVVVVVGQIPLYALCRIPDKITKRRGSVYESTLVPGLKVIPTIHPAAALRNWDFKHMIGIDFKRVAYEAGFPEIRRPEVYLETYPTYERAIEYLTKVLNEGKPVSFDIECDTRKLQVTHISFSTSPTHAISIRFVQGYKNIYSLEEEAEIWRLVATILESGILKIAQNVSFDWHFLFRRYGITCNNVYDTMVAQGIAMPELPKGLDFMTSIYTDHPYYKDTKGSGKKFTAKVIDSEGFDEYSAKDSLVLHEIKREQWRHVERLRNEECYNDTISIIPALIFMQDHGIKIDMAGREAELEKVRSRIASYVEQINQLVGYEINPASTKQLIQYFYTDRGVKPYMKRNQYGEYRPTVDDLALRRLSAKGDKVAMILMQHRRAAKYCSTYLEVNLPGGRLRCSFNPVGAADTGRLSSGVSIFGEGTNMQNQPASMKRLMLVDDGFIGYEFDLEQAENRITAYIAPEPRLIEMFETNKDVHRGTAGFVFGIPADQVSDKPGSAPMSGGRFSQRFWGKKANHSFDYGLGPKSFSDRFEVSFNDAKFIHTRFHMSYPGIRCYWKWVEREISATRSLTNLLGRKRVFMGRYGQTLFKEAYAYTPQSSVASQINRYGLKYIWENQPDICLLNQIHDSVLFQIPTALTLAEHVKILLAVKKQLETPMVWKVREFVVPAGCKAGCGRFSDFKKLDLSQSTETIIERLEEIMKDGNGKGTVPTEDKEIPLDEEVIDDELIIEEDKDDGEDTEQED